MSSNGQTKLEKITIDIPRFDDFVFTRIGYPVGDEWSLPYDSWRQMTPIHPEQNTSNNSTIFSLIYKKRNSPIMHEVKFTPLSNCNPLPNEMYLVKLPGDMIEYRILSSDDITYLPPQTLVASIKEAAYNGS